MKDQFWGNLKPTHDASVVVVVQSRKPASGGDRYHDREIPFVGGMYLLHVDRTGTTRASPWVSSLVWASWDAMVERLRIECDAYGIPQPHGVDWRDHTSTHCIPWGEP